MKKGFMMILRFLRIVGLVILTVGLALTSPSFATVYNFDVGPDDLASGKPEFVSPHGTGSNNFGYDWDSAAPGVAAGAPAGWGDSSFIASVDGSSALESERYITFRIGFNGLFASDASVTIGELASISYFTNRLTGLAGNDWWLTIYTVATGSDDSASWYKSRIQVHPNGGLSAGVWNQLSTDGAGANALNAFYDSNSGRTLSNATWSDVINGITARDYSVEEIMMIDIKLGYNNGPVIESQLDGISFTHTNGDIVNINAVPEPTTMALIGAGVAAMAAKRRRFLV